MIQKKEYGSQTRQTDRVPGVPRVAKSYPKCWGKGIDNFNTRYRGYVTKDDWLLHTKRNFAQVETEEECMNENNWLYTFTDKIWTDTLSYVQGKKYGAIDEQDPRLPATKCPYHQRCFVWQHMWDGDERSAEGEALHKECLDQIMLDQNTKIIDGIPESRETRFLNSYFVGSYDNFEFPFCSHEIRKYKWVQTPRITINYALQQQKTTQSESACRRTPLNPHNVQTDRSKWSAHYMNCMKAKGYQRNEFNQWTPMPHLCP